MIPPSIPRFGSLLALTLLTSSAPPVLDLDIGVPPGAPTTWGQRYPAITPARTPLFPVTPRPKKRQGGTAAVTAPRTLDIDSQSSLGIVRILTWDIANELAWPNHAPKTQGPITGPRNDRLTLPGVDHALYWSSLAPLLRLMFHPQQVSKAETVAHLIEIGMPVLTAIDNASYEKALQPICDMVRPRVEGSAGLVPSAATSSREGMMKRFLARELVTAFPYDPSGGFGRRFMLFAAELEPYLIELASHKNALLARNAVAALGRYRTLTAATALAKIASETADAVILMRALAALGSHAAFSGATPVLERMRSTRDEVTRVAAAAALGRCGTATAVPTLLDYTRQKGDPDLLLAAVTALARIQPAASDRDAVKRRLRQIWRAARGTPKAYVADRIGGPAPDNPDTATVRGEIIGQLALIALARLDPTNDQLRARMLNYVDKRKDKKSRPGVRAALGYSQSPLRSLWPVTRILFVESLPLLGDKGIAALEAIIRSNDADPVVRGHALAHLPFSRRGESGFATFRAAKNDPEVRIHGFEAMVRGNHPKTEQVAFDLLTDCGKATAGTGTPEQRYLWLRALKYLSHRRALSLANVDPLLRHPAVAVATNLATIETVNKQIKRMVQAAHAGEKRKALLARLDAILDFAIDHKLSRRIRPPTRTTVRRAIYKRLAGVRKHGKTPGYLNRVEAEIVFQITGVRKPTTLQQRAEFKSIVLLEEEILFSVGRLRTDAAATKLLKFLDQSPKSPLRAHACLALGVCGKMGDKMAVGKKLVRTLLDEDSFVRFCAYESLRHLTGKDFFADWMFSKRNTQVAAAEHYLRAIRRLERRGK